MGPNHQAITARAGTRGGEMDRDVTVKSQPRAEGAIQSWAGRRVGATPPSWLVDCVA